MSTASEQISAEVATWPGIETVTDGSHITFRYGRREIGHLHGDHAAHFGFPKAIWAELHAAGRIDYHPVFPGKTGPGARRISDDADVRDVIALLRLNYERMTASSRAA